MPAKLVATRGMVAGREEALARSTVVLGRSETCDIVIHDDQVSRRHAELTRQGALWYAGDLNSVNGTFIDDRRLSPGQQLPLPPGARLRLGPNIEFTFQEGAAALGGLGAGGVALPPAYGDAEPVSRGRAKVNPLLIGGGVLAFALLAAIAFLVWRGLPGGKASLDATNASGAPADALQSAATVLPAIVTRELPKELPAPSMLSTVTVSAVTVPTVSVSSAAAPAASKAAQAAPAGAAPAAARPEQLPQLVAAAFPGVPAEQLPAAIEQAIKSGQVTPDAAKTFIAALFPGVAPAQLPAALAGSFAGFNQAQIQGILTTLFPGQNLALPDLASRDGAVAFSAWNEGAGRFDIYLMNADGSGRQTLVEYGSEPAFSTDGKRLAWFSWNDQTLGLRIRDMDTGAERQLTSRRNDLYPSWAPDGARLVFWDESDHNIVTINADGSNRRAITRGEFPAWSPKGDRIAIKGCVGSDCGIVLVNPDGSNPVRITTNANDGQPAWSPDGRSIAFVSNRDGNWEIYAVNADGSWLRRVTDDIHTDGLPAWSSDGIRIAFRSDRSGQWAIYTATGIGGPPFKLTDAPVKASGAWSWTVEKITWR